MKALKLQTWLEDSEMKQAELVRRLAAVGYTITQAAICRWITGEKYPSPDSQIAIEIVTGGAVRPTDWVDSRRDQVLAAMEAGVKNAEKKGASKRAMLKRKLAGKG